MRHSPTQRCHGPQPAPLGLGHAQPHSLFARHAAPIERNEIIVRMNHHPTIQGEWISTGRSYTGGSTRAPPAQYECPPPTVCH